MKIIENNITSDYKKVTNTWGSWDTINADIETYFEESDNEYSPVLANNHGVMAANEYIEFITGETFSSDGSWIGFIPTENKPETAKNIQKLLKYSAQKFAESNFYGEIARLIKEGVLYNQGLMSTDWSNNISFKTVTNSNLCISKDADEQNKRAYTKSWVSGLDLLTNYESDHQIFSTIERESQQPESMTLTTMFKLIEGIIPVNKYFFDKPKSKFKFIKVYLLESNGQLIELKRKGQEEAGYTVFPIMTYLPHCTKSMAQIALSKAVRVNDYEMLLGESARKILKPTYALSDKTYQSGAYNFDEGGVVLLGLQDRTPEAVESKHSSPMTERQIERLEQGIDRIFKREIILRARMTNLSQFEAALNKLNAFRAIQPYAADLVTRVPTSLLRRFDTLMRQNDKEYKKLRDAVDGSFTMIGLTGEMEKLKKAAGIGRLYQGAAPAVQVDPAAAQMINGDKVVTTLASSWDVAEVLEKEEDIAQERQQQQQMLQQQQQMKQQEEQNGRT